MVDVVLLQLHGASVVVVLLLQSHDDCVVVVGATVVGATVVGAAVEGFTCKFSIHRKIIFCSDLCLFRKHYANECKAQFVFGKTNRTKQRELMET